MEWTFQWKTLYQLSPDLLAFETENHLLEVTEATVLAVDSSLRDV